MESFYKFLLGCIAVCILAFFITFSCIGLYETYTQELQAIRIEFLEEKIEFLETEIKELKACSR